MELFAIFDKKVGEYMNPFAVPNTVTAIRSVAAALKDSNLAKYPADFCLYKIGVFEKTNGEIVPITPPQHVEEIVNLIKEN